MKRHDTLRDEIEEHGFANGTAFVSSDVTPQDSIDREEFYENNLYRFSPKEQQSIKQQQ